ncbi:uncharacterized protein LOC123959811 [Micropterus dolomieu]|uniref:uncharacterized protein LOC123959811 n=1 Tax=Micropterus dolomieu TaxID=147949 RepID=UPI001E8E27E7|nr:uncharacterized protein LOC123959811 [Micropterus dolomieu]
MASRVTALLLLGFICVGFASAQIVVDCCLKVSEKRLPLHILVSYTIQGAGKGCEISATAFITKAGKTLCVSHPADQSWVQSHIDYLEKKKQRLQEEQAQQQAASRKTKETTSPAQRPDMAPWGDAKLFFCILFITCCCTVTWAQIPMDCCLSVKPTNPMDKKAFADYRQQIKGQGCPVNAMILVTRNGKKLCVPDNEPWIQEVVKHVDTLKKYCKKQNYKGKRCAGVTPE